MPKPAKNDEIVSEPIESGRRLAIFRLMDVISVILLTGLVLALVLRPWRNAEKEAKRLTGEISQCQQGVSELGNALGKRSNDPRALQGDIESLVSAAGYCRTSLESAKQSSEQSSNAVSQLEGVFGSIDQRAIPPEAPLCRSRLSVVNRCSESITIEERTTSGEWHQHNISAGYVATVNVVQWCDRNEVFVRPADSTKKGGAVHRVALSPGVPASETIEDSESNPNLALYCTGSAVALFEM